MGTVLYLGTRNGVLTVAEDGGGWAIANHDLKGWEVTEVAPAPDNPQQVLAGTRGDGVWRSEDAGAHWSKPSYGRVAPGKVRCVTVDPHDPQTIYAGCEPISMWKSIDGGASWTEIESVRNFPSVASTGYPVPIVEPHVRDITIAPDDSNTIYAALQVGYMLKTTDGGATWRLLDNGLDEDVHAIITDPPRHQPHLHIERRRGDAGRQSVGPQPLPELGWRGQLAAHRHGVSERVLRRLRLRPVRPIRHVLRSGERQSRQVARS